MDDHVEQDLSRPHRPLLASSRDGRRRRGPVIIGVVLVAALVGSAVVVQRVVGRGPDPCTTIAVVLSPGGNGGGPRRMAPADVVVHERGANGMSGFDGVVVVVSSSGYVVALADAFGPSGPTYRSGFVDAATVDGLRRCVEGEGFDDAVPGETGANGQSSDGRFCSVSDASTTTISAGPAAMGPKTVQAYALGMGDGCLRDRSAALEDLYQSLERLRREVSASGAPVDAPSSDLEPASDLAPA